MTSHQLILLNWGKNRFVKLHNSQAMCNLHSTMPTADFHGLTCTLYCIALSSSREHRSASVHTMHICTLKCDKSIGNGNVRVGKKCALLIIFIIGEWIVNIFSASEFLDRQSGKKNIYERIQRWDGEDRQSLDTHLHSRISIVRAPWAPQREFFIVRDIFIFQT